MNIRDLEYLLAVAETKHFGHAAEKCFVSQPTLSGQIRKLEESLGVQVFERNNKHVAITPIGEKILDHARSAIEQTHQIRAIASAYRDPMAGPFRLGIIPTLGPYIAPLMLKQLRDEFPQMQLILSEELTDQLVHKLEDHQLDAILLATPLDDPRYSYKLLFDEPFWLAHHRDDPLYQVDTIDESQLEKLNLLLLADGHCLSDQVLSVCMKAGLAEDHLENDLRAASLETLLQLVAAGYGSTLVPALAMRGGWQTDMGIIARPLEVSNAYRRVRLVYRTSFPRPVAIEKLSEIILRKLPNTVKRLTSENDA